MSTREGVRSYEFRDFERERLGERGRSAAADRGGETLFGEGQGDVAFNQS